MTPTRRAHARVGASSSPGARSRLRAVQRRTLPRGGTPGRRRGRDDQGELPAARVLHAEVTAGLAFSVATPSCGFRAGCSGVSLEPGGWCLASEASMGSLVVVVAQPARQVGSAGIGAAIGQGVGHSRSRVWMNRSALPLVLGVYGRVRMWRRRSRRHALPNRRET